MLGLCAIPSLFRQGLHNSPHTFKPWALLKAQNPRNTNLKSFIHIIWRWENSLLHAHLIGCQWTTEQLLVFLVQRQNLCWVSIAMIFPLAAALSFISHSGGGEMCCKRNNGTKICIAKKQKSMVDWSCKSPSHRTVPMYDKLHPSSSVGKKRGSNSLH